MIKTGLVVTVACLFFLSSMLRSQESWVNVPTGIGDNITGINFYDSLLGFAVCSSGKILKTANGGASWTYIIPQIPISLNDVRIISPLKICAAGKLTASGYAAIIRSTDSGLTWDSVYSYANTNYVFNNMKFFGDTGTVCMNYNTYGMALKTFNGGQNWSWAQGPSMFAYQDFAFVSPLYYYVFGYVSAFIPNPYPHYEYTQYCFKTSNGGSGWSQYQYEILQTNCGVKGYFLNASTGYIFRAPGSPKYSTSSGQTWSGFYNDPPLSVISSVETISPNVILVAGKNSSGVAAVVRTTNRGLNWGSSVLTGGTTANKIFFLNALTGWVSCDLGKVFKTTNGGLTGFSEHNEVMSGKYALFQSYPNPFNPKSKIKFQISKMSVARLTVFDVNGRAVKTLVDERLSPGTYAVTFDGSGLSSGIYYYKLTAGDFLETKKMVLMK